MEAQIQANEGAWARLNNSNNLVPLQTAASALRAATTPFFRRLLTEPQGHITKTVPSAELTVQLNAFLDLAPVVASLTKTVKILTAMKGANDDAHL